MGIVYIKKERVSLHRSGSVELYLRVNYFHRQIEVVVADSTGEEVFSPSDFGCAMSRYRELCSLHKKKRRHVDA